MLILGRPWHYRALRQSKQGILPGGFSLFNMLEKDLGKSFNLFPANAELYLTIVLSILVLKVQWCILVQWFICTALIRGMRGENQSNFTFTLVLCLFMPLFVPE